MDACISRYRFKCVSIIQNTNRVVVVCLCFLLYPLYVVFTGDDRQTQVVLTCGAMPKLLGLLSSNRKTVQKEACWTISNITAGIYSTQNPHHLVVAAVAAAAVSCV